MHPVIAKTFGGLSTQYYFRQFLFGFGLASFMYFIMSHDGGSIPIYVLLLWAINTLLYPYSRFVYESIVNFILGNNVFFVNAFLALYAKLIAMVICWAGAILIAPIGLVYLYCCHSRTED